MLSRELTSSGGPALPLIRKFFGDSYFFSDGSLDRKKLASLIFSDSTARKNLDLMMDPLLHELTARQISQAKESGADLCFLDFPLLFEMGYDRLCDSVWCVWLPVELQTQRLMERDGLTRQEASARINAVLSSDEKASRSQVVIDNSGSPSYTLSLLPGLLEAERQQAAQPRRRRSARHEAAAAGEVREASQEPEAAPARNAPGAGNGLADWQKEAPAPPTAARPVFAPAGIPTVMNRPEAAHKKPSARKIAWRLPSWLMILLMTAGFLLLCAVTAQSLMRAYLVRRAEEHRAEERAILASFPLEYRELLEAQAEAFNLNPAFVAAIVLNESSFQPGAVSGVGARGLMQLMPDTAEWIAHKLKIESYHFDRMWDPESNVRFGCWYLNYLSSLFQGDPVCVACAYHAGQGTVTSWLSDPLISEDGVTLSLVRLPDGPTKTYAGRVTKAYGIYQDLYYSADGRLPGASAGAGR